MELQNAQTTRMLRWLLFSLFVIMCYGVHAQVDSAKRGNDTAALTITAGNAADSPDDDFDIFLIVLAIGFCGAALGAVMVGAFASFMVLSTVVLLTIAGIISASLLIGVYKRSVEAGFKSLLVIGASVSGSVFGVVVLWVVNDFFRLSLTGCELFLTGAGGGLIGGLLLALIIYKMVKFTLDVTFNKLKLVK